MTGVPRTIIVLNTGRCGSTTLARACAHFDNYTAGHETRCHMTGSGRFEFGENHIEIDNRLSWLLGRLDRHWGDRAAYVHLTRDPDAVARSFLKRSGQGILRAYRTDILMHAPSRDPDAPRFRYCKDYVDTVTENIRHFLRDKTHVMTMQLETIAADFDRFIDWIGATGDLPAARAALAEHHNASGES